MIIGTNYYVITPPCGDKDCEAEHRIHLGKSSYGWRFLHRAYREHELPEGLDFPILDKASWLKLTTLAPIVNEYGDVQDREGFLAFVEAKQEFKSHSSPEGREWERHANLPRSIINNLRASDLVIDGYDFCDRAFS